MALPPRSGPDQPGERLRLQRPGRRRNLGQDVDAVHVFLNHLLQAANLALDAAQPQEVSLLVRGVSVHADLPRYRLLNYYTPVGYSSGRQAAAHGDISDYCDPRAATSRPAWHPV